MTVIPSSYGIVKRIRILAHKYRLLLRCFVQDIPAGKAVGIALVNLNTAQRYFAYWRRLLVEEDLRERQDFSVGNGVEADESYFGPRRVRGRRGRGAGRKVIVFGLILPP